MWWWRSWTGLLFNIKFVIAINNNNTQYYLIGIPCWHELANWLDQLCFLFFFVFDSTSHSLPLFTFIFNTFLYLFTQTHIQIHTYAPLSIISFISFVWTKANVKVKNRLSLSFDDFVFVSECAYAMINTTHWSAGKL